MKNDWLDFDKKLREGFLIIKENNIDSVKERILQELDRYHSNPEIRDQLIKIRIKLKNIENKALKKLGQPVAEAKHDGNTCYLCGIYESDVSLLIEVRESIYICNDCVNLVSEVIESGK